MTPKQYIREIGMIAAIISDNIMKELYEETGNTYLVAVEKISDWALEFLEEHKRTDWEKVLEESTLKPKSEQWSKDGISSIICWDDAVIDFAYYKLEQFKKNGN